MAEGNKRNRHRGLLKQYYSVEEENASEGFDPYNLNVPEFNSDLYLHKLLRECDLMQLMQKEHEIFRQIQLLDSEMQTLVYENYNKFISATDTIRKMKNDFKKMEEEMDHLSTNMAIITDFSASISGTLQARRQQISKLSGVHSLLKKLQFLFELPPQLKSCLENEAYGLAVRNYVKAQKVLHQYEHMPSFHGIQEDCNNIVAELKTKLREQFKSKDATPKQLAECVDLLLQLQESTEVLCEEFLKHAQQKLNIDLQDLAHQVKLCKDNLIVNANDIECSNSRPMNRHMDVLEFVDLSHNSFLSNISLVIASYGDLFLHRLPNTAEESSSDLTIPIKKLETFVEFLMQDYFKFIEIRISLEKETPDIAILVRALDRFFRRVQAMNNLLPDLDFAEKGIQIISNAAKDRCEYYLQHLKQQLADCLINIRQNLVVPIASQDATNRLNDLLTLMETSIADGIKSALLNLECFIQLDITFATVMEFRNHFCKDLVREGVIVAFFRHINSIALEFCSSIGNEKNSAPPQLILLLSRLCLNLEQSSISYLISLADERFTFNEKETFFLTSISNICSETKQTAQKLLDHFVKVQGLIISQMLRKSVETRDWLNAIEPRNVRAVMKRVVEDVTSIDSQVGQLYEEGIRKERSSDNSSRRTYPSTGRTTHRSKYNAYAPSTLDNSLMSNIQKLFSERIEIFSAVEFSKVSVMTGIVKISLKTFLECVRLRTFSRYGLQQTQVDTHYIQLYLWHFVADENLVHILLDEIMSSCINRCLDPVLMEPSVIEVICDRG